jgi:hypothetical protein
MEADGIGAVDRPSWIAADFLNCADCLASAEQPRAEKRSPATLDAIKERRLKIILSGRDRVLFRPTGSLEEHSSLGVSWEADTLARFAQTPAGCRPSLEADGLIQKFSSIIGKNRNP